MIYGETIRVPGARPISKPSELLEVTIPQESWDMRFWLGRIPSYDASKDPHCKSPFPNVPRPLLTERSYPKSRLRNTLRPLPATARPTRASRALFSPKETTKQDLINAWDKCSVPSFHREAFFQYFQTLPRQSAALLLEKELEDTVRRKSAFLVAYNAVARREEILLQLQDLGRSEEDERLLQLDVQDGLQELQRVTVDAVTAIVKWREQLGNELPFEWKEQNYLRKMRSDVKELQQSSIGKYMPEIGDEDPLLLRTLSAPLLHTKSGFRTNRELTGLKTAKIRLIEDVLAKEFDTVQDTLPSPPMILPRKYSRLDISDSLKSDPLLNRQSSTLSLVASSYLDAIITEVVNSASPLLCREACFEYQAAHLVLYSNKILDDVICCVLKEQIPVCAHEAYTEEIDREFITFQHEIMETVIQREVKSGALQWALEIAAEDLTEDMANSIEVLTIAEDAMVEELELNNQMIASIFQRLVDTYMGEEWLEIMCEDVLSDEIMEARFRELPVNVVAKLLMQNPQKQVRKQVESVYTALLKDYVSGIWLEHLVKAELNQEGDVDTAVIMPITPEPQKKKRPARGLALDI